MYVSKRLSEASSLSTLEKINIAYFPLVSWMQEAVLGPVQFPETFREQKPLRKFRGGEGRIEEERVRS